MMSSFSPLLTCDWLAGSASAQISRLVLLAGGGDLYQALWITAGCRDNPCNVDSSLKTNNMAVLWQCSLKWRTEPLRRPPLPSDALWKPPLVWHNRKYLHDGLIIYIDHCGRGGEIVIWWNIRIPERIRIPESMGLIIWMKNILRIYYTKRQHGKIGWGLCMASRDWNITDITHKLQQTKSIPTKMDSKYRYWEGNVFSKSAFLLWLRRLIYVDN